MNRSVLCGIAAMAMLVAFAMSTANQKAHAGLFGGLFKKGCCAPAPACCEPAPAPVCEPACCAPAPRCGGGLFARLKARRAAAKCCAPAPTCCEPAPVCCEPAPAPVCCEPAPAPCCEPAPAPCCEPAPAPCCGGEVVVEGSMGGSVMGGEVILSEKVVSPAAEPTPADAGAEAAEATEEASGEEPPKPADAT